MNVGGSEFLIIAALALLLFGPSLLAFWFGYVLGQRKKDEHGTVETESVTEAAAENEAATEGETETGADTQSAPVTQTEPETASAGEEGDDD